MIHHEACRRGTERIKMMQPLFGRKADDLERREYKTAEPKEPN